MPTNQRCVTLAEPQEDLPARKINAPASGKRVGVTYDQAQPVESIFNQDSAGTRHADEVPAVDAPNYLDTDTADPNSSPESPDRSSSPEPYALPGE